MLRALVFLVLVAPVLAGEWWESGPIQDQPQKRTTSASGIIRHAATSVTLPREWVRVGPGIYQPPNGPVEMLQATYIYPTGHPKHRAPGVWHREVLLRSADLPRGLPPGAHGVGLIGIGITTNPPAVGTYSITCAFRAGGSTYEAPYSMQTCSVNTVGWNSLIGYFGIYPPAGARVPGFVPVTLRGSDCSFEWKYNLLAPSDGPLTPGVNCQVNFVVAQWTGEDNLFPWAP